ncbi:hypothetical protein LCGC14_0739270 [marine sediment metagenome]|uniref:Uncharacterized protein n=1 Tax=marine sediment metagenome TaxID=412755 RepID=A0A0F9Q750_9ZZZZ
MGMYDSFLIDIKCPFCDEVSKMECQTKELSCELIVWQKGDYIGTDQYNYLDCATSCEGKCKPKDFMERTFDVSVKFEAGIVTGKYDICWLPEKEE